jgi:glycosyltransferase involved in cell wall biosynthesis
MEASALVSIVLPVYNGERYLREGLDSILAQNYPHWELIVVDDCSTDATPEILRDYSAREPRIRIHRNEHNLKLPASLNVGFALSKGDILTWTSDDNLFLPQMIERLSEALAANPGVDFVYAAQEIIAEDGRSLWVQPSAPPETLCHFNIVNACFAYRRRVHTACGNYDDGLRLVEDWDYWLRVAARFEMLALPDCLYRYRTHAGTLSNRHGDTRWLVEERMLLANLPRLANRWPRGVARGYLRLCDQRWRHDDRAAAWGYYLRALSSRGGIEAVRGWRHLLPMLLGKWLYFGLKSRLRFLDIPSVWNPPP